ncbi:MAG TPA: carboxypeptidase-like regulatory domain-containing protein, partial [Thermoplasmata archaeon]|nr:carboxypeptidase-like regulatory domain-containing protein [Thermoplasmata archaeon]
TYWFYEPNGTYAVTAWETSFKPTLQSVTVKGAAVTSNFLLPRFYWEVSGTVRNGTSASAISGATVTVLSGPSSYKQSATTSSTGKFILWLANGSYTLNVSAKGYTSTIVSVKVAGAAHIVNVSMVPSLAPLWVPGSPGAVGSPRYGLSVPVVALPAGTSSLGLAANRSPISASG